MNARKKSTALAKTVTAPVSSVLMVTDSQRKASALIRHDQLPHQTQRISKKFILFYNRFKLEEKSKCR